MNQNSPDREIKPPVTMLSRAEERDLIHRWQVDACPDSIARLCHAYSPLVMSIARRYASGGSELDDLVQEGNIGLMEALQRFESNRGFRLSTYARWWIESLIRDFGHRHRAAVRPPKVKAGPQIFPTIVSLSVPQGEGGTELGETLVDDGPGPEVEVIARIDGEIQEIQFLRIPARLVEFLDISRLQVVVVASGDSAVRAITTALPKGAKRGDRVSGAAVVIEVAASDRGRGGRRSERHPGRRVTGY